MVIRKLGTKYVLYTSKVPKGKLHRRRLGTFRSRKAAIKRERQIQFFKHLRR